MDLGRGGRARTEGHSRRRAALRAVRDGRPPRAIEFETGERAVQIVQRVILLPVVVPRARRRPGNGRPRRHLSLSVLEERRVPRRAARARHGRRHLSRRRVPVARRCVRLQVLLRLRLQPQTQRVERRCERLHRAGKSFRPPERQ